MKGLSTHVLDTQRGEPAAGVNVTLERDGVEIGRGVTGEDGRIADLLQGVALEPGWYRIRFDLAGYYGSTRHFFTAVTYDIAVSEPRHHHVPLLISPFGATSYRGS